MTPEKLMRPQMLMIPKIFLRVAGAGLLWQVIINLLNNYNPEDKTCAPACFLCNMVNDGIAYSFGIILEPMRSDLGLSIGSVSLIGGALTGVTMLIGPLAAHSVNKYISYISLN